MLNRLTLDQLRILVAAVEEGSFSAAGRLLGRAQSAVSQAIQTLEDELEVRLFDRSGNVPVLTESGRAVLEDARIVLHGAETLRNRAATFGSNIEPELSIAVDDMFPGHLLIESMRRISELFPTVRVTIYSGTLNSFERRLKSGVAQIGICTPQKTDAVEYQSEFLTAIPLVPVAAVSHPLAALAGTISNEELNRHLQLVLVDSDHRLVAMAPGSPLGARHWLFADQRMRLDYLLGGFGWCAAPHHFVTGHLASGHLKRLDLQRLAGGHLSIGLHIIHRRASPPGKVARWLIEDLRSRLGRRGAIGADEFGTMVPVGTVARNAASG